MNLDGLKVCLSGNGQGDVAAAIEHRLHFRNVKFVKDDALLSMMSNAESANVAICTTGSMKIRSDPRMLMSDELRYLYEGNYLLPRAFLERHAAAMIRDAVRGLIIFLGSNAAWYGNPGAEDYAAFKAALRKYVELRRRTLKEHGIRLACIGFGGIDTSFWSKATAGASAEVAKSIVPGARRPLTADDAAFVVQALIELPDNVAVSDSLVLSTEYQ